MVLYACLNTIQAHAYTLTGLGGVLYLFIMVICCQPVSSLEKIGSVIVIGGAVCLVLDPTSRRIIDGVEEKVDFIKENIFYGRGFGFFVFNQKVLPSYLSAYSTSILVFYISVVYVIASLFRSAFVPMTWEIFIWDAPFNDDILMICQSIHIYRVQMELEK